MYRCGVLKLALVCMFTTLQNLQHHVRMLYGDSTVWAGTDNWAVPVSGISQGNGAGPQIWAIVSTPILDLLQQEGYGAVFKALASRDHIKFVGYSFVDDTDLIQTGPMLHSTAADTLPLMQAALDLWNQGLSATGGALVPEKSFWYSINFKWKSSRWQYDKNAGANDQSMMTDHLNQWQPLMQLPTMEAHRTLGVYLAPDGNNQLQELILLKNGNGWKTHDVHTLTKLWHGST